MNNQDSQDNEQIEKREISTQTIPADTNLLTKHFKKKLKSDVKMDVCNLCTDGMKVKSRPKTSTERVREFRKRKKLALQNFEKNNGNSQQVNTDNSKRNVKTSTERTRKFREKKKSQNITEILTKVEKLPNQLDIIENCTRSPEVNTHTTQIQSIKPNFCKRIPKTPAERSREYRKRKKLASQLLQMRLQNVLQDLNLENDPDSETYCDEELNYETSKSTGITIKVEPGLTDDLNQDDPLKYDTNGSLAGCSRLKKEPNTDSVSDVTELTDSMIDIGNTTYIKQEDESYLNSPHTDVKIKIEPGLNEDDASHDYTMLKVRGR
ncbi:uncharacterized protein [Halyomorpha halys]|uniref:uncharacterized protein isoform X3 n=1 Tax=Halyomorpha halys TaxID=286706 RepID=UPI0006D4D12B|nr:uncharacterized protein LOC106689549 isoform X2 [Halyomorpha halys]